MPRTVMVRVTDEDIGGGKPLSIYNCALAHAAKRVFSDLFSHVDGKRIALINEGYLWLPGRAVRFASKCISGEKVGPFEFEIDMDTIMKPKKRSRPAGRWKPKKEKK